MKGLKSKITDFHYGKFSFFFFLLFLVPSVFYFLIIKIKNFLYSANILKEEKVSPYVICVGNLTTGGVGKTPLVIEIANYLSEKGKKVVILSRGYGGKLDPKIVSLVRSYNDILINDPNLTGDEICLIANKVSNCAVITCANRLKGAKYASLELEADFILMDDGFSNRKVFKDLNVLLIDTQKMFGNGFCLPYGPLREPLSEIKRAKRIVFVNKNNIKHKNLDNFIKKLNIKYLTCKMENGEITNILTNEAIKKNEDILAFSGIGQPEQFFSKLTDFNLKETISFDDHFEYRQDTINDINNIMQKNQIKMAITTEKDMVKILNLKNIENFYVLKLNPIIDLDELFKDII